MDEADRDPSIYKLMEQPYALNPEDAGGLDGPDSQAAFYDKDFKAWAGPFVMGPVNTRVVRRTHALLGHPYGRDFRYGEATLTRDGPFGFAAAAALSMGSATMMSMTRVTGLRHMMERYAPQPGEGPSEQVRESGYFKIALLAKHPEDATKDVLIYVNGKRDPGYGATARMLAESALCLAKDGLNSPGGVSTPAVSMGDALVERLNANADVTFSEG